MLVSPILMLTVFWSFYYLCKGWQWPYFDCVCLSVCLSVCLLVCLSEFWCDFLRGNICDQQQLIRIWWSSGGPSGYWNF